MTIVYDVYEKLPNGMDRLIHSDLSREEAEELCLVYSRRRGMWQNVYTIRSRKRIDQDPPK